MNKLVLILILVIFLVACTPQIEQPTQEPDYILGEYDRACRWVHLGKLPSENKGDITLYNIKYRIDNSLLLNISKANNIPLVCQNEPERKYGLSELRRNCGLMKINNEWVIERAPFIGDDTRGIFYGLPRYCCVNDYCSDFGEWVLECDCYLENGSVYTARSKE